eukprot:gene3259-6448_t
MPVVFAVNSSTPHKDMCNIILSSDANILTWRPKKPFQRGFESFSAEEGRVYQIPFEQVEGSIPDSIFGTLIINGAGRNEINGEPYGHWFDGDGLVTKISFRGESGHRHVEVTSRYVQTTRKTIQDTSSMSFPAPGPWTLRGGKNGSLLDRLFPPTPTNPSNTNVFKIGDRLFALAEGGVPIEIDTNTLETKGEFTFNGALPSAFSAHPKTDAVTGETFNQGLILGLSVQMTAMKISKDGQILASKNYPMSDLTLLHDLAITDKFMIIPLQPFYCSKIDLILSRIGLTTIGDGLKWHYNKHLSSFMILKREDLSLVTVIDTLTFSSYHVCNAHDNADGTVSVYLARHRGDRTRLEDLFKNILNADFHPDVQCDLIKYDLDINKQQLIDAVPVAPKALSMEFPSINPKRIGKSFRFVYSPCLTKRGYWDAYQKIDVISGEVVTFKLPEELHGNECVFVAHTNSENEEEDSGSLLAVVYNSDKHTSSVLILDARTMLEVARVPLPHHIPYHFHGDFFRDHNNL